MTDFTQELVGLSLHRAIRKIRSHGYSLGTITYDEAKEKRLTITHASVQSNNNKEIFLTVSGTNPIHFLPSIYHNSDFLKRFLWIPQHLNYEVVSILDNLHTYFTPMETSEEFLNWIGSWFNISNYLELDQEKMRAFLQNAMTLYRWRGTKFGLSLMIRIVTGIEPEIYENELPYGDYKVMEDIGSQRTIYENLNKSFPYFTVHIPVSGDRFTKKEKTVIYEMIKQERPVNAEFFVTYKKSEKDEVASMVISDDTVIEEEAGIMK